KRTEPILAAEHRTPGKRLQSRGDLFSRGPRLDAALTYHRPGGADPAQTPPGIGGAAARSATEHHPEHALLCRPDAALSVLYRVGSRRLKCLGRARRSVARPVVRCAERRIY